ncbi:MAG: hypothetical protein IT376_07055 [Polyangiaceae bacterium]|nr:hypothetical protein [Polyangiaceae bacterium]
MTSWMKRAALGAMAATALGGAFYAGTAYAADPRLDDAIVSIDRAIALLEAAQNPNGKRVPFGGHRKSAIRDLKQAKGHVEKAKKWADDHPPPAPSGSAAPSP